MARLLRSAASLADWPPKKLTWCYVKINAIKCDGESPERGVCGRVTRLGVDRCENNDNKIAETDDGVIHQKESPL